MDQISMFDEKSEESWRKHWKGMPEFNMEDKKPFHQIIVSFESNEDVRKFRELIGQKVTYKTKSIWFPALNLEKPSNFAYVDTTKNNKDDSE